LKVLQINTSVNVSAPGRIVSLIGNLLIKNNHESFVAFGQDYRKDLSTPIKIGNKKDILTHFALTRLFDRHGFGSVKATYEFVRKINKINPDIIHLHNIHGYYLNIEILFRYLKDTNINIVWTFHDCWPFTGHCSFFDRVNCERWQSECNKCPLRTGYPASWIMDRSRSNFIQKRELFTALKSLVIVTPSEWLADHVKHSFFRSYQIIVINNGVDLQSFRPVNPEIASSKYRIPAKRYVLGVANIWSRRKGYDDFIKLREVLDEKIPIVLVGLSNDQKRKLPKGIIGISHIDTLDDLSSLYSAAGAFINPTWTDNFPTVNLEALACGTPVITYDTGGSGESIDGNTGIVVPRGNIEALKSAVLQIFQNNPNEYKFFCRIRAEALYDAKVRYEDYIRLYEEIKTC